MKLLKGLNMSTESEFLKALAELKPLPAPNIEYRLHYNDAGQIIICSLIDHPENTQYVVVDKQTYDSYHDYYVEDHKIKKIDRTPKHRVQLKRSSQGYRVVKNHAGIILADDEEYENVEYYDNN